MSAANADTGPGRGAAKGNTSIIASQPPRSRRAGPRLAKRQPAAVNPLPAGCPSPTKPFDAVERELSLALDAILNVIDTYRELKR